MRMEMVELPYKVREWLKRDGKQRHFSVQDGEVFFAPGAIYPILPLWVEDADEMDCEGMFCVFLSSIRYFSSSRDSSFLLHHHHRYRHHEY